MDTMPSDHNTPDCDPPCMACAASALPRVVFTWRVPGVDDEGNVFLYIPHGDPNQHEVAIDFEWETAKAAIRGLAEWNVLGDACAENWILVKQTHEKATEQVKQFLTPEAFEFYKNGGTQDELEDQEKDNGVVPL